jgi:hypothetical protein
MTGYRIKPGMTRLLCADQYFSPKYRNSVIPAKAGIHIRLDTGSSPV